MSLMSLDKKKIETALANTSGSNPNLFISIHACAPDYLPEYFKKYYSIKDIEGSFSATVPENTIVITFTPDNMYGLSTDVGEGSFMERLRDPKWVDSKNPTQVRWEHRQNAKLYLPGDKMYNQLTKFDEIDSYFDIFTLDGEKYDTTVKAFKHHGEISRNKREDVIPSNPSRRRSVRTNPVSEFAVSAKDKWEFSSKPLQHLINKLKSPRRNKEKEKIRILYIFACNPPTNVDGDLDKYTSEELSLDTILTKIEDLREKYSTEGLQRFAEYFGGSRHTSMLRRQASEEVTSSEEETSSDEESKSEKPKKPKKLRRRDSFFFSDPEDQRSIERTRSIINRGKRKGISKKKTRETMKNARKYGITKSGNSCFSPCEKSICSKIFCSKWGTCKNELGIKEQCTEPDFKKSGKKKKTRKKQRTKKKKDKKDKKEKKKKKQTFPSSEKKNREKNTKKKALNNKIVK